MLLRHGRFHLLQKGISIHVKSNKGKKKDISELLQFFIIYLLGIFEHICERNSDLNKYSACNARKGDVGVGSLISKLSRT